MHHLDSATSQTELHIQKQFMWCDLPEGHRPERIGRDVVFDIIKLGGDVLDFVVELSHSVGLSLDWEEALSRVLDVTTVDNDGSSQRLLQGHRESPSNGEHSLEINLLGDFNKGLSLP